MAEEPLRAYSVKELEEALRSLKGVQGARVVINEAGEVEEIHVVVESQRSPKQMVRDVESLLLARFNLSVDHRKISVAQLGEERKLVEKRLKFHDLSLSVAGTRAKTVVRLKKGEEILEGEATGAASSRNILTLFSQATLNAVAKCLPDEVAFSLNDILLMDSKGRETVVVLVDLLSPEGEEPLAGAALVKQDVGKAAVLATLSAINRRLAIYISEAGGESAER